MKIVFAILISLFSACTFSQSDVKIMAFEHTGEMDKSGTTVILSNRDLKIIKDHEFLKYKDTISFYKIDDELLDALIDKLSKDKNVRRSSEEESGVFKTTVAQDGRVVYFTNETFDGAKKTMTDLIAFLKTRKDTGGFIEMFELIGKEIKYRSK